MFLSTILIWLHRLFIPATGQARIIVFSFAGSGSRRPSATLTEHRYPVHV